MAFIGEDSTERGIVEAYDNDDNPKTPATAETFNEPFFINKASYDSGSDTMTVNVGRGQIAWGNNTIITKTGETAVTQSPVSASTTYYVYINSSGNFDIETDSTADENQRRLGNVVTAGDKTVDSINDGRSHFSTGLVGVSADGASQGVFSRFNFKDLTVTVGSNGEVSVQGTSDASALTGTSSGDLNSETQSGNFAPVNLGTETISFNENYSIGVAGIITNGDGNFYNGGYETSGGNITGMNISNNGTSAQLENVEVGIFGIIA